MTATPQPTDVRQDERRRDEPLQEYCSAEGSSVNVDRAGGVIRGVKILGLVSRNGRRYQPEALRAAAALYEGAKVNLNHARGNPASPRDYQDRIGTMRNVEARPDEGLFADFHFNPKHALAEQLAWDAEHAPRNVGFSHNVLARTVRRGEQTLVEAITQVRSVDLVADPGTTDGLFESRDETAPPEDVAASRDVEPRQLAEQVRRLREEVESLRRRLAVAPRSREQMVVEGLFRPLDAESFVRAIT